MVDALRRYDPGLRVRWSPEKKKWAVTAPFNAPNPNVIPKPVRFVRVGTAGDFYEEVLLPENSERNIQYRTRTYVICWATRLTPALIPAIAQRDSHRSKKGLVGLFDQEIAATDARKKKELRARTDERVYAGWDRFKFDLRKNPNAEDGTGVSIKGVKGLGD